MVLFSLSARGLSPSHQSVISVDLDDDGVGDVPHTASGALQLLLSKAPALELFRGSAAMHALDSAGRAAAPLASFRVAPVGTPE